MSLPQPTAGGVPRLRRGALAGLLVLAIAPVAACATGTDAQTLRVRPENAATAVGDVEVQNAVVIVAEDGNTAAVSASLFNNGSGRQTLDSVTIRGAGGSVRLTAADGRGRIAVPANGSVLLGGKGNPSATLEGSPGGGLPSPGAFARVTFDFSETGEVTLNAAVVPPRGSYQDFAPTPQPSVSAGPDGSASPSPSGSESAKGTDRTGETRPQAGEDSADPGAPADPNASPSQPTGR